MIDYLRSLFLLMKTEDQRQSLHYTLLYIKEQRFTIRCLPYRCVVYLPIKSFVHIMINSKALEPLLSRHCKCDRT